MGIYISDLYTRCIFYCIRYHWINNIIESRDSHQSHLKTELRFCAQALEALPPPPSHFKFVLIENIRGRHALTFFLWKHFNLHISFYRKWNVFDSMSYLQKSHFSTDMQKPLKTYLKWRISKRYNISKVKCI